jgi:Protein of unknown function (DUF2490)
VNSRIIAHTITKIVAMFLYLPALAQTAHNVNGWYMYFGDHPVSERFGIHLEGQWRRSDVITAWQQLLLRPAINYKVNDRLSFSAGYAYVRSYPYGGIPGGAAREHRMHQQASVRHALRFVTLEHRFRLEQRFEAAIGSPNGSGWDYSNRARYRLQGRVPLGPNKLENARFYLALYDEVFANWGAHANQTLDQNRAYGALGINTGGESRLEIGYLHQYLPRSSGATRHNHTLQLSLSSDLPFRRKPKS